MERNVAEAAQDLADALKQHVNEESSLRGAQEDAAQKALAQEYKDFQDAVKARREKHADRFNDADDDTATVDNPSGKYLRFAVEGDDYILKPGSNEIVSYSFGIPAARVAAIASGQLFSPHGVTVSIVKGKATINREKMLAEAAESAKKESEERAAMEARLKAERSVKEALTANVTQRITSQAQADIARISMPPPAPVRSSELKGKAAPPGTPVVKDKGKDGKAAEREAKQRAKKEEAERKKAEKKRKALDRKTARKK